MDRIASDLGLGLAIAIGLFVPGLAALRAAGHPARGLDRLGLAMGASLVVWPVLILWTTRLGFVWSGTRYRGAMLALVVVLVLAALRDRRSGSRSQAGAPAGAPAGALGVPARLDRRLSAALVFVLVLGLALRVLQAQGIVAAPWVDGLHHTVIVQRFLESGGVPADYRPYIPVDGFNYHFGFHALAAAVAWLSGRDAIPVTLWVGQALNAGAVLTVFVLALRLADRPISALVAALVPASLYWFPAYYLSWGRFTQLAGLVALPVALIVLAEGSLGSGARPRRALALGGIGAAGLALLHYRVFVFYLVAALIWGAWCLAGPERRRAAVGRLLAMAALAALAVAPWFLQALLPGARGLAAADPGWVLGSSETVAALSAVPRWIFTQGTNGFWLGLAGLGLLAGILRRRPAAFGVALWLLLSGFLAAPFVVGLPPSWMLPPFAWAIALFLPVALGLAFLSDAVAVLLDIAGRGREAPDASGATGGPQAAPWLALAFALALALAGAWSMRSIVNAATIIARAPDLAAGAWLRANSPPGAGVLVASSHWHLGSYRGLDGGYWLPLTAGRAASIPGVLYVYGTPDTVRAIGALNAEISRGDALADAEILALMDRAGADYVYVGPEGAGAPGKLSAERLRRHPGLVEVYARDGVAIFARREPGDGD